jgi:hypothetical protein
VVEATNQELSIIGQYGCSIERHIITTLFWVTPNLLTVLSINGINKLAVRQVDGITIDRYSGPTTRYIDTPTASGEQTGYGNQDEEKQVSSNFIH